MRVGGVPFGLGIDKPNGAAGSGDISGHWLVRSPKENSPQHPLDSGKVRVAILGVCRQPILNRAPKRRGATPASWLVLKLLSRTGTSANCPQVTRGSTAA